MSKKTEIPTGWQKISLGKLGAFSKGAGVTKSELAPIGHNAIRYGELYTTHHFKVKAIHSRIPDDSIGAAKSIKYGDILFAGSGETIEEIGKSATYLMHEPCYAGGDIIIFSPKSANSLFLSYLLNTYCRRQLSELGQGQSVVHIYKRDLEKLSLAIPHPPEQTRIVSILETWDSAIEKLTRKTKLKKAIKKGLMQKLLTGKVRLPGFSDEWTTSKLGDVCKVTMGQSPSSSAYNENGEGLPLIQGNNDIKDRKSIGRIWTTEITKTAKKNSIILTVRAPVGCVGIAQNEVCLGRGVCALTPEKVDAGFIYSFLVFFEPKWGNLEQGSTFSAVNGSDIRNLQFQVPQSKKEQIAIANVLTAADQETEALEKKLTLLQEQKKFLINNLVTGKIRVPAEKS